MSGKERDERKRKVGGEKKRGILKKRVDQTCT